MSIIWGPEQASIEYSAHPVKVLHWRDNIGDSAQGAEIVWATPASDLTLILQLIKKLCTTWTWGGSISWWTPSAESVSISPSPSPLMWWSQGSKEPGDISDDQGTHHLYKGCRFQKIIWYCHKFLPVTKALVFCLVWLTNSSSASHFAYGEINRS